MRKYFYIALWILLGIILSFLVHAALEIPYIYYLLGQGIAPVAHTAWGHGYCALPDWLRLLLLLLGIVGGTWAGFHFWRMVYIERPLQEK